MTLSSDIFFLPLSTLAERIGSGEITATRLIEGYVQRIRTYDDPLHAMITVREEGALEEAAALDAETAEGKTRGTLHGLPIVIKDATATAGIRTTQNSRLFQDYVPTEDATAVARLKAAGAIILGKTNLNEMGFSLPSEDDLYPPTYSPWNPSLRQVGSSSGSGVAVAAGFCAAATGSDGGGSIRLPAGQAGLIGVKPTRGRVSQTGTKGGTIGTVGPMTRTARDAAVIFQVMAGYDLDDPNSVDQPVPDYVSSLERDIRGMRLGVPRAYIESVPVESEVARAFEEGLQVFKSLGITLVDVSIPDLSMARAGCFIVLNAENFPKRERYLRERFDEFGPSAQLYQLQGAFIGAGDYLNALAVLRIVAQKVDAVLEHVDVLAMPTSPVVTTEAARRPGEHRKGINAAFTAPFNLTGHPAISIPCGMSDVGLPIGLQLAGKAFDELTLLQLAHGYEKATEWCTLRPRLSIDRRGA